MNKHVVNRSAFRSLTAHVWPERQSRAARKALRLRFHLALLTLDVACLIVSFLSAFLVYTVNYQQIVLTLVLTMAIYFPTAVAFRAYSVEVAKNLTGGVTRSLHALAISSTTVLFAAFILKVTENFSRVIFCLGFALAICLLALGRYVFLYRARTILHGNPFNVGLITGSPSHEKAANFTTVLHADDFDPASDSPHIYNELALALRHLDRVIVECPADQRLLWSHALQGANISVEIAAPELAEITPLGFGQFRDVPTILVARGPLGLFDRATKRLLDLGIAVFAIILLAPVLALVMLAIRLESEGPILFVQDRIGRSNRIFKILKFRSMRVEQADGSGDRSTQRADDRVTRVGRIIRATSIDELPQLLNVVRGDMSIVGPRPHALGSRADGKLFWEIDSRYWHRHATRPGMTGLAQIRGYRGATTDESHLTKRLNADLEYARSWSLWLDIKIILMTFGVIIHSNAY